MLLAKKCDFYYEYKKVIPLKLYRQVDRMMEQNHSDHHSLGKVTMADNMGTVTKILTYPI